MAVEVMLTHNQYPHILLHPVLLLVTLRIEGLGLVLLGHDLWYPPKNQLTLIPAFLITVAYKHT